MPPPYPVSDQVSPSHHRLVFGAPLTSTGQIVLLQIMAHVEGFVGHEGIFRKSGSKPRVDRLVQELREKGFQEILLSGQYKPHDYTSMLKQFFSELPEPLFLKRHLGAYMQTSGNFRNIINSFMSEGTPPKNSDVNNFSNTSHFC